MLKARLRCVLSAKYFIEMKVILRKVMGIIPASARLRTGMLSSVIRIVSESPDVTRKQASLIKFFGLINTYDFRQHPLE